MTPDLRCGDETESWRYGHEARKGSGGRIGKVQLHNGTGEYDLSSGTGINGDNRRYKLCSG